MAFMKRRGGHRAECTKLIKAVDDECSKVDPSMVDHAKLLELKTELLRQRDLVLSLDDQIQSIDSEEFDFSGDISECSKVQRRIAKAIVTIGEHGKTSDCVNNIFANKVKLPMITLPHFDGSILDWEHFWDLFQSSIHSRTDICDASKFHYLRTQLSGEAAQLLSGFNYTKNEYPDAVQLLKTTYGNNKRLIEAHLHSILDAETPNPIAKDLRRFRSVYEGHLRGLNSLGANIDAAGYVYAAILIRKLPTKVRDNINREGHSDFWDLENLRGAIEQEIGHLEATEMTQNINCAQLSYSQEISTMSLPVASSYAQQTQRKCQLCNATNHYTSTCTEYTTVEARRSQVMKMQLCFNCLKKSHRAQDCKNFARCKKCNKKHHTSICTSESPENNNNNKNSTATSSCYATDGNAVRDVRLARNYDAAAETTTTIGYTSQTSTILPTAIVNIVNKSSCLQTRALMDQGSQRTFIQEDLKNKLGLESIGTVSTAINGFGGKIGMSTYEIVKFDIEVLNGRVSTEAVVVKNLPKTIHMPGRCEAIKNFMSLGIDLADDTDNSDNLSIGILIGSDQCFNFIHSNKIGDISLIPSNLGTIIAGSISKTIDTTSCITVLKAVDFHDNDACLDDQLKQFWELESIGIKNDKQTVDDDYNNYKKYVKFEENKFIASLPWKSSHKTLPNNYYLALGRLNSNLNKMRKTPSLLCQYDDVIQTQLQRDFIEKIDDPNEFTGKLHYISHHGIVKDSATTPLRVVYDCSAKQSSNDPSLNDCLMSGPSLVNDLLSVLIKFRSYEHACISDIEKAYLMVGLDVNDRDATRFLWPENPSDKNSPVNVYRFKVVFFGGTCSQFLLNISLKKLLRNFDNSITKDIDNSLYVDNLAYSCKHQEIIIEYYNASNSLLSSAGFTLREWATNSRALQQLIPADKCMNKVDNVNVLGFIWDVNTDLISYKFKSLKINETCTKRSILSDSSKLFDPIGLLSPVTIRCRLLMQELWREKLSWDEAVSNCIFVKWSKLIGDINEIQGIKFDRNLDVGESIDLYVFCDASTVAYGAVCYIKTNSGIKYVMCKSRVAPIKIITLPQLELTSASIAARLAKYLIDIFGSICKIANVVMFSDSQIALSWIVNQNSNKSYVTQRVESIHKLVPKASWHYVKSADNPADYLTRGLTSREFLKCDAWLTGPTWLPNFDCSVKQVNVSLCHTDVFECSTYNNDTVVTKSDFLDVYIERFSSFNRLIRVTAFIYRFFNALKFPNVRKHNLILNSSELIFAENKLIYNVQLMHFDDIFVYISNNVSQKIPTIVKQLNIVIEDDILYCKGRLGLSNLITKHPILLPSNCHFTKLIIRSFHFKAFHAGVSQTLAAIRQKFWIPKGRQRVKSLIHACVTCKRVHARTLQRPSFAPLPQYRIVSAEPYSTTGVDYAGPLLVKDYGNIKKVYICLFTCMITRAIYLELAHDATAENFMLCFRRFSARMSVPKLMLSDNAHIFSKTAVDLKIICNNEKVLNALNDLNVEWKFIPVNAPHFGGAWERMVGLTKNALKKVLGRSLISSIELTTVLCEVESMINDRPLTYVSDDICDDPLTPSHLIFGRRIRALGNAGIDLDLLTDPDFCNRDMFTKRNLRVRKILSDCWNQWQSEYLTSLRERHCNVNDNTNSLRPGDIVLISNKQSRNYWRLAKVVELRAGVDGVVRSVLLTTRNGLSTHPIINIVPLEIESEMRRDEFNVSDGTSVSNVAHRIKRRAAIEASKRIALLDI